jgi:uncharacterized protein with HEPN domain
MSFEDFLRDGRTIDAVVRKLTIIGEAAVHVPDSICGESPDIPWIDMRTMRNFVVHEYFGISERIVWDTVQNDLPAIIEPLKRLLLLEAYLPDSHVPRQGLDLKSSGERKGEGNKIFLDQAGSLYCSALFELDSS